jgi:Ca-activated chloride channel homolog
MKARALFLCAIAIAAVSTALGDGLIVIRHLPPRPWPPPHPWPMPMPRPHPVFAPLEVVYHKVDVTIDGQKATTRVDQEFANPNNARLEGDYLFPIPRGAHIDKFTLRVGDQDLEAELLDAGKARAIYEDIVRRQRDPALLEYTGRGAFRVRIFPIEPHSRKRVQLTYTELLKQDSGLVSYIYPLNTEKFSAQPLKIASVRINVRQSTPIKALYSPSHPIDIRRDGDTRATIGWETSNARPDTDFQLLFSTAENDLGISLITQRPDSEDGTFLLLAAPGAEKMKATGNVNPKDVVFVVDTSGSMAGRKLAQAKKALAFCVENLNDADRFEVVRFSTESEPCFEKLAEVTPAHRARAQTWIEALKPIGGTAINDALQHALRLRPASTERPFVVIFLTDGQPTVGETDENRIVAALNREERGAATRIFCFGIGNDVNTHLLDKIVERTRAASQFVLPDEDLEVKVSAFFTKIKEPLLTDLKITWPDGVRVVKAYPHPLPDLFRGDQLVLTGRFSGTGEGDVVIEGLVNGTPRRIVQRVRFPDRASGNEFIPQLWATRRVGWLLDEVRLRGDNAELRDEIVQLARRYAIVTPYTSYLIVEDEARRAVPLARRSLQSIDGDAHAQAVLREGFNGFLYEKSGDIGTRNARASSSLKDADRSDSAVTLNSFEVGRALASSGNAAAARNRPINGAGTPPTPAPATVDAMRKIESTQQAARVVAGKTFFQNGPQWSDADTQRGKPARTVRVQFATDEYFKLLAEKPEAAAWLALGRNVNFTLGDTLYEVTE